ncbi:MAG: hypothetical protein HY774_05030 [Acidobacteria bacterium]|nr:hypothetical protein [Acidobacteriota bacterium]
MPDKALKILKESLPTRCEVCHQADQFDPVTSLCGRCQAIVQLDARGTESFRLACPRCGATTEFWETIEYCYRCLSFTGRGVVPTSVQPTKVPRMGAEEEVEQWIRQRLGYLVLLIILLYLVGVWALVLFLVR